MKEKILNIKSQIHFIESPADPVIEPHLIISSYSCRHWWTWEPIGAIIKESVWKSQWDSQRWLKRGVIFNSDTWGTFL